MTKTKPTLRKRKESTPSFSKKRKLNTKKGINKDKEFEKILQELEDPKTVGIGSWALPTNATPLEKSKYDICQSILIYKQDNRLTTKQVAQQIQLSIPETKEIFLAHLDKFTLDRLMTYASKIFSSSEVKLTIARKRLATHV